jgi:hypothetical protein
VAQRRTEDYWRSIGNSLEFCQSGVAVGLNIEENKGYAWFNGIGCGRWECPNCGPVKAAKLRKKIRQAWEGETCYFLTLTCDSKVHSVEEACLEISHAWDLFGKRLRRKYPGIIYFKALEFRADHRPHLHILLNRFIPHKWISATWSELFAAPVVWIEKVGKAKVARYVTKYATKWTTEGTDSAINYYLFKLRRFSFSRNFYALIPKKWKRVYHLGQSHARALLMYEALVRELLETYDLTGVSNDGSVCFFKLCDNIVDFSP